LTYIKCNYLVSKVHRENVDSLKSLSIFQQYIRGLRNKTDELINSFEIDVIYPHILCLRKHHMVEQDLLYLTLPGYLLGSRFCRLKLQRGGVCIFVRNDQCFNKIEVLHHFKEQDLEICAIYLETKTCNLIIISWYRAPLGDFILFLRTLGTTLKYL
jgi:hypothetical protein